MFYRFIPISNLIIFILLEAVILNISYLSAALNNLRFLSLSTSNLPRSSIRLYFIRQI